MRCSPQNMFRVAAAHGLKEKQVFAREEEMKQLLEELKKEWAKGKANFLNLPDDENMGKAIRAFAHHAQQKYDDVIVLGIGGSALTAEALLQALAHIPKKNMPRIHVVDTIDPDAIDAIERMNPRKTLTVVISKSGETVETLALFLIVYKKLRALLGKRAHEHLVFVTDPTKGFLRKIADKNGIISFPVPPGVPGRYAALSAVGLLPAALAGIDIQAVLKGARDMRQNAFDENLHNNVPAFLALTQYLLDIRRDKHITVIMAYADRLEGVLDWYLQLVSESLGKKSLTAPTPIKAMGPRDQHSQLQLFMDGPNNKQFLFLDVARPDTDTTIPALFRDDAVKLFQKKKLSALLRAEKKATATALQKANRPNQTITLQAITPETIGALIMLLQIEVVLRAKLYGVNPYDQPGVELGKEITKRILLRNQ